MRKNTLVRDALTPENALSWPISLFILAWNLLANFLESPPSSDFEAFGRLALLTLVHVAYWLTLLTLVRIGQLLGFRFQGWSFLGLLVMVSALRGWIVHSLLLHFQIPTNSGLLVRVLFSVLYVGLAIAVASLWIYQVRQHNQLFKDFQAEQRRLLYVRHDAEGKIFETNDSLISRIQEDLLSRVRSNDPRDAQEGMTQMRDAIDHVVRPVSHLLSYPAKVWNPEGVQGQERKISWRRVISESLSIENIHPLGVTLAYVLLVAPSSIEFFSLPFAWQALLLAPIVQFVWFKFFKAAAARLAGNMPRLPQASISLFGYLLGGLLTTFLAAALVPDEAPTRSWPVQGLVFALLIGISVSLVVQARRAMASVEKSLRDTNAESSWEIARIRLIQRGLEKGLANQLHGKIQATMAAIYLRLHRSLEENVLDWVEIDALRIRLSKSIEDLGRESDRPDKFSSAMSETAATWRGVCDIDFDISPEIIALMNFDRLLSHSLEDLIPELAFNAVKHGKSTKIRFSFELIESKTLRLVAEDNGSQQESSGRVGLGSRLLDDYCISWSRQPGQAGMITSANLPVWMKPADLPL